MKKLIVFLLGFIAGVAFSFASLIIIGKFKTDSNQNDGMTFFEQSKDFYTIGGHFVVLQTVKENYALAYETVYNPFSYTWNETGVIVLITNDDGEYYYDNLRLAVPDGKCMKQVGIYNYNNKNNEPKTVPIVKKTDK